jgi:Double zinc ribbon
MALSADYPYPDVDGKLQEALKWAFSSAFHENKAFEQSEAVKTISNWYNEAKEYKAERQEEGDNKHAILSVISDKIIDELIKHVEPCYKDSIIQSIGINTHFREGNAKLNCSVKFASIKPFVKFVKQVNGQETASATFRFQLDSSIYINKLQIHANSIAATGKSIDIDKLGMELELTLLQVTISSMQAAMPFSPLNKRIKLVNKKFEIKDFHLGTSLTDKNQLKSLDSLGNVAQLKGSTSIICQKCGNQNQSEFNFCNICGTSSHISCHNCGNSNSPSATYCNNCAGALWS